MKKIRSKVGLISACILVLICNMVLTGCWDYREIDDVDIVVGLGIDKDTENDRFKLTHEVLSSTSSESRTKMKTRTIQSTGKTIFEAVRKIVEINGKAAYWPHMKVMIVNQDVAKKGINTILDYTGRDAEFRSDLNLLITDNCSAEDIFLKSSKDVPVITFKLYSTLNYQDKIGSFEWVDVWNFADKIHKEGIEPTAPLVHLHKENGKIRSKIGGMAVFKEDKMVGKLNEEETKYYLFIDDEIENQPLVLDYNKDGENINVTLEIFGSETKLKPREIGDKIVMDIDIKCQSAYIEIEDAKNVINDKDRKKIEQNAERIISKNIKELVDKLQQEYNSDILGLGYTIKQQKPKLWKKVGSNWDEQFKKLNVNTKVDMTIVKSSLTIESIETEE